MNHLERLAENLTTESKAYGYTLTIWGGGALLINQYGTPTVLQIFLYVTGALVAFGALALLAFRDLFSEIETGGSQQLVVTSMVHVFATFLNLLVSYLLLYYGARYGLPVLGGFLLIGFQATFTYNLLLLAEEFTARVLIRAVDGASAGIE